MPNNNDLRMYIYIIILNISKVSENVAVPTWTKAQIKAAYQKRYRQSHLERDRKYRHDYHVEHKASRNAYTQIYYIENKDAINEKQAEKFKCQCGGKYTRSNKRQHERQGIHIKSLEINEIIN